MNLKAQTVQVEEEQTIREIVQGYGLEENLYFYSVDGVMAKPTQKVKAGQSLGIIPIIKGG